MTSSSLPSEVPLAPVALSERATGNTGEAFDIAAHAFHRLAQVSTELVYLYILLPSGDISLPQ